MFLFLNGKRVLSPRLQIFVLNLFIRFLIVFLQRQLSIFTTFINVYPCQLFSIFFRLFPQKNSFSRAVANRRLYSFVVHTAFPAFYLFIVLCSPASCHIIRCLFQKTKPPNHTKIKNGNGLTVPVINKFIQPFAEFQACHQPSFFQTARLRIFCK